MLLTEGLAWGKPEQLQEEMLETDKQEVEAVGTQDRCSETLEFHSGILGTVYAPQNQKNRFGQSEKR